MNHDKLDQLLRDADAADAPPAIDASLAGRMRARARRQRRVRTIGGAFMTIACVFAIVTWIMLPDATTSPAPRIAHTPRPDVPVVPTPRNADVRAELLAISAEADRLAAAAESTWAAERPARRARKGPSTLGSVDVSAQIERAAFTMVYQAARMPDARGADSPAADVYRQVSESFPHTRSADVARQRLSKLKQRKEG